MPTVKIGRRDRLTFAGDYKPGDPPPSGYFDWHSWADVQHKAGLRQVTCGMCGLWRFPQELTGKEIVSHPFKKVRGKRVVVEIRSPICKKCADK